MAINYVASKNTRLSASAAAGATSFTVSSLKDREDSTLTMASFGTKGYGVIDPGGSLEEHFTFTGISSTTLTGVSHVSMVTPYTETSGLSRAHSAGVRVVLATNSPAFYDTFANLNNSETVTGTWTFTSTALPQLDSYAAPTANAQLAAKKYVDDVAAGGTATIDRVVVAGTAGETISAGQLVYFDTGTNNEWMKCDADTAATVDNVILGIAQGAGTDGNAISGGVLLHGLDSNQSGMTAGDPMFASNTAGAISSSAGTVEVQIGAARNTTNLYFSPRFNQQITEDQQDALAGSSGTPSSSNLYVTANDNARNHGTVAYAASAAGTDTYAVTLSPAATAYANGMVVRFKADVANTGAATLNVNGLGAVDLVKGVSTALTTGDIVANQIVTAVYNSTGPVFQVLQPPATFLDGTDIFVKAQEASIISGAALAEYGAGVAVMEFSDAATETAIFEARVPRGATGISAIEIFYVREVVANLELDLSSGIVNLAAGQGGTIATDTFGSDPYACAASNATIGVITVPAGAYELTGINAGDQVGLKIIRNGSNANDTYNATWKVLGVKFTFS